MPSALLALLLVASVEAPPDAAGLPTNQYTFDVDALSLTFTFAHRRAGSSFMMGGGIGAGLSPILGTSFADNSHFDTGPGSFLWEAGALQAFLRFGPAAWLRVDGGLRAGVYLHGGEDIAGGPFLMAFVAPTVGWRWFWIGPRVSAGQLFPEGGGGRQSAVVVIDYVMVRLAVGGFAPSR
jgi:hypothetical protein